MNQQNEKTHIIIIIIIWIFFILQKSFCFRIKNENSEPSLILKTEAAEAEIWNLPL